MLIRWRNDVISTERDICAGGRLVLIARRAALVVGLVDKPNARKQHLGHIPLVGGIAVYLTLMLMTLWQPAGCPTAPFICCASRRWWCWAYWMTALICPWRRASWCREDRAGDDAGGRDAAFLTGVYLGPSGSDARLWRAAAYAAGGLGAINAYNMVDGIDGQLGALSCVTFVALAILFGLGGREDLALWCWA